MRFKFIVLLFALILLIMLEPWLLRDYKESGLNLILSAFVLIVAAYDLVFSERGLQRWITINLFLATFIMHFVSGFIENQVLQAISFGLKGLFYGLVTINLVDTTFHEKWSYFDRLLGASCGYIMLGLTWGRWYGFLETIVPGSFEPVRNSSDLVYFGFSTLTTLGYGEIIPVNHWAQSLAVLTVTSGVLYLAILVSLLVGGFTKSKSFWEH